MVEDEKRGQATVRDQLQKEPVSGQNEFISPITRRLMVALSEGRHKSASRFVGGDESSGARLRDMRRCVTDQSNARTAKRDGLIAADWSCLVFGLRRMDRNLSQDRDQSPLGTAQRVGQSDAAPECEKAASQREEDRERSTVAEQTERDEEEDVPPRHNLRRMTRNLSESESNVGGDVAVALP